AVMPPTPAVARQIGDDLPYVVDDWNTLTEFFYRLNQNTEAHQFRLPSEAEWEFACRAGTTSLWSFGTTALIERDRSEFMWYFRNGCRSADTQAGCYAEPVGLKPPNSWGFHDMHGNMAELTSDLYARPYTQDAIVDPRTESVSGFDGLVARGGGLRAGNINGSTDVNTTSAYRGEAATGRVGIRLALVAPGDVLRAAAGPEQWVVAGDEVLLDGSASSRQALSYEWAESTDNPASGILVSDGAIASFTPMAIGTYHFTLRVSDGVSTSESDNVAVTVVHVDADGTVRMQIAKGVEMDFVWIEPGSFTMGITQSQEEIMRDLDLWHIGRYENALTINSHHALPAHDVTLTDGFYLGKYEVTQAQWTAVLGTKPWTQSVRFSYATDHRYEYRDDPQLPANLLQWQQITDFLDSLNVRAGHQRFHLPTEAQWEYAALAGSSALWWFGYDEDELPDHGWYYSNALARDLGSPQPVGQKLPNRWGLHDMDGNVQEWCTDYFDGYRSALQTDPVGPITGRGKNQRGGTFRKRAISPRERFSGALDQRFDYVGLRLLAQGPKLPAPVGVPLSTLPDFDVPEIHEQVQFPLPDAPTTLVLDEDFSDPSLKGWKVSNKGSDWCVVDGVYRLTTDRSMAISYFLPPQNATNYTVDVRIRARQGEGWIFFSRAHEEPGWRFGLFNNRALHLVAFQDVRGSTQPIPPPPDQRLQPGQVGWSVPWSIPPDQWHDVRISVRTDVFDVSVNSQRIHQSVTLGHATPDGVIGIGGAGRTALIDIARVRLWHGAAPPDEPAFADVAPDALLDDGAFCSDDPGANRAGMQLSVSPNPFVDSVSLSYRFDPSLPVPRIEVYNVLGQPVWSTDLPSTDAQGAIIWDGRDEVGRAVADGVYFIRLHADSRQHVQRVHRIH
ncbi:MAG: SUMF1/EgtB/PvdO family nonheme iron enzyme, partial [Gemmatimonadetes bacterium]|nr:SUMF1/EgtB/PvdO family nonheme iron enzyme [Gemmatimonadota bacterium]